MNLRGPRCFYCERFFGRIPFGSDRPLKKTRDHIFPKSKGGNDSLTNILNCCQHCNTSKGAMTLEQWRAALQNMILQNKRGGYHHSLRGYINIIIKNISSIDPTIEHKTPTP